MPHFYLDWNNDKVFLLETSGEVSITFEKVLKMAYISDSASDAIGRIPYDILNKDNLNMIWN